jgi:tetratricopeptide (TPR) repeat protein
MSQFPKRLIDELGEGDARRLLESGRSDEPPARMVAAAILTATKRTSAAEPAPESSVRVSGASHRGRNIALLAGALVIGAAALIAGTRDESRTGLPEGAPANTSTREVASAESRTSTNIEAEEPATTASAEGTAIAELPDAPVTPRAIVPAAKTVDQTADLLREANRLRARGQWAEAAATYRKVIDLGPDSAEAYPADVALGNLELQQNRPLPALARYEHALAKHPGGALSEEARWGKARALRAAGRTAEERAALEDFRKRHPDSPLVSVAMQRLAEIGN